MTFRRILAPLSGLESDQRILDSAAKLADKLKAHLDVFFVRLSPESTIPGLIAGGDIAHQLRANMAKAHKEAWDEIEKRSRDRFDEYGATGALQVVDELRGPGVASMRFLSETNEPEMAIARLARSCDLTVFNLLSNEDRSFDARILEHTLISSGRPCLFLPQSGLVFEDEFTVGIAWDGGTEVSRAISQALPIIQLADKVEIISVESGGAIEGRDPFIHEIGEYFTCLGLPHECNNIAADYQKVEVKILEIAEEQKWDLLIMGGYSHSPWREMLVSGPTRHILRNAKIPVVQAH